MRMAPTNWVEAGDRMENPALTPMWCYRRNCNSKLRLWPNQTDTGPVILFFFYEADKTTSYVWVLLKKKKAKQCVLCSVFRFSRVYKFIFCSQYLLSLSLTLASRVSPDAEVQNNGKFLYVFSFVCLCVLLFFPFHLFGKAEDMND